jgi:hypothetical protein
MRLERGKINQIPVQRKSRYLILILSCAPRAALLIVILNLLQIFWTSGGNSVMKIIVWDRSRATEPSVTCRLALRRDPRPAACLTGSQLR